MSHLHNKSGQHDLTASAFIVCTYGSKARLLFHLHKKLGVLLQFGGHVELDETPYQALIREIQEESGYDSGQLKLLQPKTRMKSLARSDLHPYPVCINTHSFNSDHFHTDIAHVFITEQLPKHKIVSGESKETRLVTRSELETLPNSEIFEAVREIGMFVFDECLENWEQVSTGAYIF